MQSEATKRSKRQPIIYGVILLVVAWVILVYRFLYDVGGVINDPPSPFGIKSFFEQWNETMFKWFSMIFSLSALVFVVINYLVMIYRFQNISRVDYAEKHLLKAVKQDWEVLTKASGKRHSERFDIAFPGFNLGQEIKKKQDIYCTIENSMLMLAGPGAGKTSGFVIPFIVNCPGPVVSTSNKDDVYRQTYKIRQARGRIYLFDIMDITGLNQSIWYNPLKFVVDELTAGTLAGHFMLAASSVKQKDFWNSEGQTLLADYLLAASLLKAPITKVYDWLTRQAIHEAIDVLKQHDFNGAYQTLLSYRDLAEATKSGIYATARYIAAPLANKDFAKWITPANDSNILEFDPALFVQGSGTIYALSSEKSEGNASALVTAICNHITDEAEAFAKRSYASHLPHPMLIALDEAANICKWSKLPDLYSYYRAYGITLLTVLQSYAQGYEVWGQKGMEKLYTAANIILFLGGITEIDLLKNISQFLGQYEYRSTSLSYRSGGVLQSSSVSDQRIDILTPSELQKWPQGKNSKLVWGIMRKKPFITRKRIYQPRRTLILSSDGNLILETKPYFQSFDEILMNTMKRGEAEYEESKQKKEIVYDYQQLNTSVNDFGQNSRELVQNSRSDSGSVQSSTNAQAQINDQNQTAQSTLNAQADQVNDSELVHPPPLPPGATRVRVI